MTIESSTTTPAYDTCPGQLGLFDAETEEGAKPTKAAMSRSSRKKRLRKLKTPPSLDANRRSGEVVTPFPLWLADVAFLEPPDLAEHLLHMAWLRSLH